MNRPNTFKYFRCSLEWEKSYSIRLLASNETTGIWFRPDGARYYSYDEGFSTQYRLSAQKVSELTEMSLREALNLYASDKHKQILKWLDIKLNTDIIVSDATKIAIIQYLQKERAFNQDSAIQIKDEKDLDTYCFLAENKIIDIYGVDRFYFSKNRA